MSQVEEHAPGTYAPTGVEVLVSAGCCAGLAAAAIWSPLALALGLMGMCTVLGLGWMTTLGLSCARGCHWTLALGGMLVCLATMSETVGYWPRSLPGTVAAVMLIHMGQQVLRQDGRPRLAETMGMSVLAIVLCAAGAAMIPLGVVGGNGHVAAVALAGAAAGTFADLAGRARTLRAWVLPLGMALAGAAALAAGRRFGIEPGPAALLGVSAAIVGHPVRWLLAQVPSTSSALGQVVVGVAGALSAGAMPLVAAQLVILA